MHMDGKARNKRKEKPLDSSEEPENLKEMEQDELSGLDSKSSSLASSGTDEDEDEGLGDGNIGRSKDDLLTDD
jgi:hypothetical protein